MTDDKLNTLRPVRMLEVNEIDQDAKRPKDRDEGSKCDSCTVTREKFMMKKKRQDTERYDGQQRGACVNPHEFAIEGSELCQVLLPAQATRNLKAGEKNGEMTDPGEPESEIKPMREVI